MNPLNRIIENLEDRLRKTGDTEQAIALTEKILDVYRQLPGEKQLWTDEDVLRFLRLTDPNTLAKMRSAKRIPYFKSKGVIRYIPDSIIKWAKNNEIKMNSLWRKRG